MTEELIWKYQEEIKLVKHCNWQELSKETKKAAKITFGSIKNKKQIWRNELCENGLAEKMWKCSEKTEYYEEFKHEKREVARIIRETNRHS